MFNQSPWLKKYIDMNTNFRKEATNKFDIYFFKLMNNSCYGKTCEDTRKYKEVKLVTTKKQIEKLSCRDNFKRWHIYGENLASVLMATTQVTLNKPRYIGATILALSKTIMYEFHYQYMMKKFPDCKLLFTDTDSFCYYIPNVEDIDAAFREDADRFDFSNYDRDHKNWKDENKMKPGKMKDESPNQAILEFVGLRAKMYSMKLEKEDTKCAVKGVCKRVTEKILKHEDFRKCLMEDIEMRHPMTRIGHTHHQLQTISSIKKTLSPFNDKKWIEKEGNDFKTHSFGHKDIPGKKNNNNNVKSYY